MKNDKERKTDNSITLYSWIIINFILFFFVRIINAQNEITLVPQDLKCEYRVNPEGIDIVTTVKLVSFL